MIMGMFLYKLQCIISEKLRLPLKTTLFIKSILKYTPFLRYGTCKFKDLKLKYRTWTNDRYIINEIFNEGVYFKEGFTVSDADVVVDIGAHIGTFTLYAASAARHGRVVAFEPMPDNYKLCKYNIRKNNFRNVELLNVGIAKDTADKSLYITKDNYGGNSLIKDVLKNPGKGKKIEIDIHTIDLNTAFDTYNVKKCNLLKIDCEGAEYEILESLTHDTWNKIDKIIMEYHELPSLSFNSTWIVSILKSKGFSIALIKKNSDGTGLLYAGK